LVLRTTGSVKVIVLVATLVVVGIVARVTTTRAREIPSLEGEARASPAGPASRVTPAAASSAPSAPSAPSRVVSRCPEGMLLVRGEACDEPDQVCLKWMDPPPYQNLRCAEYARPVRCKGTTKTMTFCIDRDEVHEATSELPVVDVSFVEAKASCASRGAHLCKEDEWVFACEGEAMLPYPYGHARDSQACNIDRTHLGGPNGKLRDLRAKVSDYPRCTSPFGVHDMTGNVDEWVEREVGAHASVLHGGWWLPGRNRCRATTAEHGPEYSGKQVGYRCCASPKAP
jgi:hypothetical protein